MTFSIVGRCDATGQFGIAVSSSSPAVAARCAYARAGIGAVASQNITDPRLGSHTLDAMASGLNANAAISSILFICQPHFLSSIGKLAVDNTGHTAIFSGRKSLGINAECQSQNAAAAGNLLANITIPESMVTAYHQTNGHIGDRLLAAMFAGLSAGGEAGDVRSAGLLIVDREEWPLADLRCDWTDDCPIAAISTAWGIYKPQMDDYVTRALNPDNAPSYGVPGDT